MPFFVADNIISSLGFTSHENFESLLQNKIGIKTIEDNNLYPGPFPASVVNSEVLEEKFSKINSEQKYTRLEKMMILSIHDTLNQISIDTQSKRTGILLSTTKGNIDLLEPENAAQFPHDRIHIWKLGEVIGKHFNNPNQTVVLSNACISGVLAINTAVMLIESGQFDDVIVCGGDIVSKFVVSGFMSFLSLSEEPCKPFDKNRNGLSLGEAAGTIILSKSKKDKENIAFLGGASANDANHISGPSRSGEGSYFAIKKALRQAGISSGQIDHISAHGTATLYNDEMESISISRHNMERVPVNSMKGYWGHTLGAAGIVETAVLLHEMRTNKVIKTAGFQEHGVSKPINIISKTEDKPLTCCLKMASGFGGSNASLILQKI